MTWLSSILISLLTGVLGLLCGGFIMNLCVSWYRVSSMEGKSGYAVITVGLLGGIAGIIIGLIVTRLVASSADPGFLKGLGYASGSVLTIALVALGLCRLNADLPPEIDGQSLEVVVEVRCPPGFVLPKAGGVDDAWATAAIYLPSRGRLLPTELRLAEASKVDHQWVVPVTLYLGTRLSPKYLSVHFSKDTDLTFSLPLRSKPKRSDMEWSSWIEAARNAGQPEPAEHAKFRMRYRVQISQLPPQEPDPGEAEAARFAALAADAPLADWVGYASPAGPMERNNAVAEVVEGRQDELAALVRSSDVSLREKALLMTQYVNKPTPALADAVLAEGHALADDIRESNAIPGDDPRLDPYLSNLNYRFNCWKRAYWVVSTSLGQDGKPIYGEIHELASIRAPGTTMDEIKLNARVILDELEKPASP